MERLNRLDVKTKRLILLLAFGIILIVQIFDMLYWKKQKGGYFVDEFFTMECVSEYNISAGRNYMYYSKVWSDNDWMDVDALQERLRFDVSKSLFKKPFAWNIGALSSRNTYFALLNVVCTIGTSLGGQFSISDYSIALNIGLFVLIQITICLFVRRLSGNSLSAILFTILHGFAGITISLVEYVRMYMLVELFFFLIIYLHYLIWEEEKIVIQILYEVLIGITGFLAYRTQALIVPYMGIICVIFAIGLLCMHKYRKSLFYFVPILLGGATVCIKSGLLKSIVNTGSDTEGMLGNFYYAVTEFDMGERIELLQYWYEIMWHQVFGARISMLFFLGITLLWIVWRIFKHIKADPNEQFVIIISMSTVLYFIFTVIVDLERMRYNQYTFVTLMIVVSFVVGKTANCLKEKSYWVAAVVSAFVLLVAAYGAFKTHRVTDIENIFPGDREALSIVREDYSDWDNLVYHDTDRNGHGHLYDGINAAGPGTMFRYITQDNYEDFDAQNREHFLLWTHAGNEITCEDIIRSQGYDIEYVGRTHISDIFKCIKK